jgi:hypothetical protein
VLKLWDIRMVAEIGTIEVRLSILRRTSNTGNRL